MLGRPRSVRHLLPCASAMRAPSFAVRASRTNAPIAPRGPTKIGPGRSTTRHSRSARDPRARRRPVSSIDALVRAAARAETTPNVRALARRTAHDLDHATGAEFQRVALDLARRGARHLAFELFEVRRERVEELGTRTVEQLGAGLDTWGEVDCFAYFVAGPAWRAGVLSDAHVRRWARSKDRWKRRLALVATVPLNVANRGGSGDARRTLTVCALLAGDAEPVVVSALSWALRALVPRERKAVERFLAAHEARLAPRVLREVGCKLRTGCKA